MQTDRHTDGWKKRHADRHDKTNSRFRNYGNASKDTGKLWCALPHSAINVHGSVVNKHIRQFIQINCADPLTVPFHVTVPYICLIWIQWPSLQHFSKPHTKWHNIIQLDCAMSAIIVFGFNIYQHILITAMDLKFSTPAVFTELQTAC
jgi:hypothetical protein